MKSLGLALALILPSVTAAAEFHRDLRGLTAMPEGLVYFGASAREQITFEPEGMRIRLPADRRHLVPTGFDLALPVNGDFEITLTYELLELGEPQLPYGAGLNLFVRARSAAQDDAIFGRFKKPKKGDVFHVTRVVLDEQGKGRSSWHAVPAETMKGKLRLVRTGAKLAYLVAGEDGKFRELATRDFATEDLGMVRVAGNTGQEGLPLDVRLIDIHIKAEAFELRTPEPAPRRVSVPPVAGIPNAPAAPGGEPTAPPRRGTFLGLLALFVALAGVFVVILGIRNRRLSGGI